jgi:hypothetical protein
MRITIAAAAAAALAVIPGFAQEPASGFVISLKNGSTIRGRTLSRDEASGRLRLTMTETSNNEPKSYAVIAMDDAEAIRAPVADTDSITIKLRGGSQLKCKEFILDADKITVKLGTRSQVEVPWDQIESISFGARLIPDQPESTAPGLRNLSGFPAAAPDPAAIASGQVPPRPA